MTRKLQILRGTTAQNNAYTGAVGELTMDTDRNEVRIHDGQTVGGIKISDRNMPILTSMFFDHITNDMSWLRADTFSWHSGSFYESAYKHLADELKTEIATFGWVGDTTGIVYATKGTPSVGDSVIGGGYTVGEVGSDYIAIYKNGVEYEYATRNSEYDGTEDASKTDTIGDITITYYTAEDGHKICLPDQESNLAALYESTGVAWYYILDTENKQFKLPRTKWGFTGLRDSVGGYVAPALPNITGTFTNNGHAGYADATGAFTSTKNNTGSNSGGASDGGFYSFDASRSSSIYGNSDTVQPPATQMYLYFYVGNFEQSAVEQTAGITAETLNGKVDLPAEKAQSDVDFVVESQLPTAENGYTWYRKHKSGWVEQGGRCTLSATSAHNSSNIVITLPVPIKEPESAVLSYNGLNAVENFANCENQAALSATTVTIGRWNNGNATAAARGYMWVLYGLAQ